MENYHNSTSDSQGRGTHTHSNTGRRPSIIDTENTPVPERRIVPVDNRRGIVLQKRESGRKPRPGAFEAPSHYSHQRLEVPKPLERITDDYEDLEASEGPSTHRKPKGDIRPPSPVYRQDSEGRGNKRLAEFGSNARSRERRAKGTGIPGAPCKHQQELQEARERISELEDKAVIQERSINNLRELAVAQLASDNSSSFADDKVEWSFRKLFKGDDFQGWIRDYMAVEEDITNHEAIVRTLQQSKVLAYSTQNAETYLRGMRPGFMQAFVEGALVRDLCQKFLSSPFFRYPEHFGCDLQKRANTEAFVEWRLHTYEALERQDGQNPETLRRSDPFRRYAQEFYQSNGSILKSPDQDTLDELTGFYKEFSSLAQRLWKLKTCITVEGLEHPSLKTFSGGDMVAHDLIRNARDCSTTQLDGRPVQVLVRPRIVSRPLRDRSERGVVWSQAVVWV
ncbi:hypothetical protein CCUS01_07557 [Colletotrichum cuscutae]|uniref:Uncharacterized protein n=1 Tax=Colletotrichum cuscutae TaxID=1209917 RepID=A0AAI9XZR8_9PEZI|nr:hypothetical protein CCUS01_07557 [Colletotrichum cuscutae]